ncbi:MAG: nitroreductase family protein [Chitinophagaceae bacterium]
MRKLKIRIRHFLRGIYRTTNGFIGFVYDFFRFLRYGGWREDLEDIELRNYNLMMAYHGLEKSLSYKNRNPKSGWKNAERVFHRLKVANNSDIQGYHDKAAKQVLTKFLELPENVEKQRSKDMLKQLATMSFDSTDIHGAIPLSIDFYRSGELTDPESFFFSRYSLREYRLGTVSEEVIKRAVKLAMKTPSVCNRHAWHVYHSSDPQIIKKALYYQNGNRPFGEKVPNLLIITTDLKAFFAGAEHYQHWIDGGLFSMSLMYAFHSLGLASCPLNWSQPPRMDMAFRNAVKIRKNHTVIMMIAVGYPDEQNIVCSSSRRPLEEIYSQIELL